MLNHGIKIPKSAYGFSSPDHKMILTSKFPVLKLFSSGTGTLVKNTSSDGKTITIAHNLGYIPQTFVAGEYLDENSYPSVVPVARYKRWSFRDTPGLRLWESYRYNADATNLYIIFTTDAYYASEVTLDYLYYIFYDPME